LLNSRTDTLRGRSRLWGLWIAVIVVAGIALPSGSSRAVAQPRPGRFHHRSALASDPLARGSKVAFGINLNDPTSAQLDAFSAMADTRPKIVMWYQTWDEPLYFLSQLRPVSAFGAIPMITWDPILNGIGIPLSEIAAGRYDAYIKSAAIAAARWKRRIYIRFGHEMNLTGSQFGPGVDGNTPAAFVAAWRHVVRIFRRQGVTNVEWVWSPNVDCDGTCPFRAFYPGDAWVDWVALDGYNYSSVDHVPWKTFGQVFGPSYAILTRMTSKPVMIGETASAGMGGSKAQWIRGMGRALVSDFPRVRALVWFQRVKETDWRINSSPGSLGAFRALVRSRLFSLNSERPRAARAR
jgi:hypothetical protein